MPFPPFGPAPGLSQAAGTSLFGATNFSSSKNLLVLGTSIEAGQPTRIYPIIAGAKLAIVVNNQAIAGTAVRGGVAANAVGSLMTGSIAGTVMTITAVRRGSITAGDTVRATTAGTPITSTTVVTQLTGTTGGIGTYTVSASQTLASTSIYTGADPFGCTAMNYQQFWQNLSHTIDDTNLIIGYWSYFAGILANSPPGSLTSPNQAAILASSYQVCAVPYAATSQAFTFCHDYNDYWVASATTVDPTTETTPDSVDTLTYYGASNIVMQAMVAANPDILVSITGYYASDNYPPIVQGQIELAQYWNCPICRTWEKLRWTLEQITTTGYWSNGNGVAGIWTESPPGSPQTISRLQRYLPDKIHPHLDQSGIATGQISEAVTEFYGTLFTQGRYTGGRMGETSVYRIVHPSDASTITLPPYLQSPTYYHIAGTPSGAFTATLPAFINFGQIVYITNATTVTVTINGNGNLLGDTQQATTQLTAGSKAAFICFAPGVIFPYGMSMDSNSSFRTGSAATTIIGGTISLNGLIGYGTNTISGTTYAVPSTFASYMNRCTGVTGCTITLPSAPTTFFEIFFIDAAGTANVHNITVNGNGKNINGSSTATISTSYGHLKLFYDGTQWLITG